MNRSVVIRIAGATVSLVCLGYFAVRAMDAWKSAALDLKLETVLLRLAVASAPLLLGYVCAALAWVAVLRFVGLRTPVSAGSGIYLTAQFAKYLPGNVGHYAGRLVLAVQRGDPASTVALAMTLELALLLAVAAVLSLPMLGFALRKLQEAWEVPFAGWGWPALVAAVAAVAALMFALRKSPVGVRSRQLAASLLRRIGTRQAIGWLALVILLSAAGIVLTGVSLLLLDGTRFHIRASHVVAVVTLYSVAWAVGMFTPGVPAGLGIREAVLVEGLTPLIGVGGAVSSALLFRLLTTVVDLAGFGIGLLLLKIAGRSRGEASGTPGAEPHTRVPQSLTRSRAS